MLIVIILINIIEKYKSNESLHMCATLKNILLNAIKK